MMIIMKFGKNKRNKMKTIELEEIAPYMNETPICEQTFIDCGFERVDVPAEERDRKSVV